MTNLLNPSDLLRLQLMENGNALIKAREDAALLDRLNSAATEIARLVKEGSSLTAMLSKALDKEAADGRKRTIACVRNLKVIEDTSKAMLSSGRFTIRCEMPAWDYAEGATVWTDKEFSDFDNIPAPVYLALMDSPSKHLPASILDLAPSNPEQAIDAFLTAKSRGYIRR